MNRPPRLTLALACLLAPLAACAAEPGQPVVVHQARVDGVALLAGKRVMILGDSITQNGAWVSFLDYFLAKENPGKTFDLVSIGLASETTSGLSEPGHAGGAFGRPCIHERLTRALKSVKPQVVIACYGMNDGIYLPHSEERMKAFETGMTKLASACSAAGTKVVLVTPPVYDGSVAGYDDVLARFAAWEVTTPPAGVVAVADLHTPMAAAIAARKVSDPKFKFAGDGVHPGQLGHLIMALEVLKGLGIPAPAGTPEEILPKIQADPAFALVAKRRELRSAGWLNHVGYKREKTVPPGAGDIAAVEKQAAELKTKADSALKKGK